MYPECTAWSQDVFGRIWNTTLIPKSRHCFISEELQSGPCSSNQTEVIVMRTEHTEKQQKIGWDLGQVRDKEVLLNKPSSKNPWPIYDNLIKKVRGNYQSGEMIANNWLWEGKHWHCVTLQWSTLGGTFLCFRKQKLFSQVWDFFFHLLGWFLVFGFFYSFSCLTCQKSDSSTL